VGADALPGDDALPGEVWYAPIKNPVWEHRIFYPVSIRYPVFFPDILRVFDGATTPLGGVGRSREQAEADEPWCGEMARF